jgi:hypothetical protein
MRGARYTNATPLRSSFFGPESGKAGWIANE